ncbi:MAG: ATP-binding protein [Treponema sp.]|nr:ATP-binding protein [Spirochaetia bacterium]MDD7460805.1 ATP-binding protein [Spirochaetales bacterium]MDY5812847.1 ATP-binding protein [Treponema sp.]
MYLERHVYSYIERMLRQFKIVLVTGSRQVGKSTMLKEKLLPGYDYAVLDDYAELDMAKNDPAIFIKNHKIPLIIDEVQRAPELFLQLKYIVDQSADKGKIVLTGSQSYKLLKNASDSLAGRVCIVDMASLSMREKYGIDFNSPFLPEQNYVDSRSSYLTKYDDLWKHIQRGSMPELFDESIEWESFYRSYVRTYLERDVAELINSKNLLKFNNFMKCLAARTGELVNSDAIARDVGVNVRTIQEWTSILESSGIIRLLHSYENSITNRTVKTPKVYFMDTGLVCYLVGWTSAQVAMNGAMNGALFENFVISEVIKSYYNSGHDAQNLYFYRDKEQKEIDLVIEKDGVLYPIEIKKSSRPALDMTKSFGVLSRIPGKTVGTGCIICQCEKKTFLSENIIALPVEYL